MNRQSAPLRAVPTILAAIMLIAAVQPATANVPMDRSLVSVRIRVGLKDTRPTVWKGTYKLTGGGKIVATDGWRFAGNDFATLGAFQMQVRRNFPLFWQMRGQNPNSLPIAANGVILTMKDLAASSKLTITAEQGEIVVPMGKTGFGQPRMFMKGNMEVQRVPTARLVVQSPTEDYAPSAAATKGEGLAVAYIAFTHGEGFRAPSRIRVEPKDFSYLSKPTGGDQLLFAELKNGAWTKPAPLTDKGGDLFRTATAVDGDGRVWVFWSANTKGNWDLYARVRTKGTWGKPMRLTTAPGPDINPAVCTDAKGKIWLAWQAFAGKAGTMQSDILVACQDGAAMGKGEALAKGPANEWTPALAASTDGQVALAWDTYEKGHYDVLARIRSGGTWGPVRPVATTIRNEARPSAAYDKEGRLWIAYESAPQGWGKDFGPYDQAPTRAALYRNRRIGVKVLVGKQTLVPPGDVNEVLPMPTGTKRWPKMKKGPYLACGPRLAVDARGRVWLSARIRMARFIGGTGTSWTNFLTTCDPQGWRAAAVVPNNDGLLHETPALVPAPGGGIRIVSSCDGRLRSAPVFGNQMQTLRRRAKGLPPATTRNYAKYPDIWVNWEIACADTGRTSPPDKIELKAALEEKAAPLSDAAAAESEHIRAIRAYRTTIGGQEMRILRGEFHRHTEVSSDGGGDGTIFDMWRYAVDMAGMDWLGFGDHDYGNGREFTWWLSQKTTDVFHLAGTFTSMHTYERSCGYPDGHRNAVLNRRGIRALPRLAGGRGKILDDLPPDAKRPNTPDTQMFYKYLRQYGGVCASHTSGTNMGTDWRDNDPKVEPIVEIYQGDRHNYEKPGAPRDNTAQYSLGGWRPLGFVSRALMKGYRLGFQSSSDHISTHMSYCNVFVAEPSRKAILEAMQKRRIYGATDNIIADVRCGEHFMGEEYTTTKRPTLQIKLIGTAPFARVVIVKDNEYVYSVEPNNREVEFTWTDRQAEAGKTSYYYVRGEQVGKDFTRKVKSPQGQRVEVKLNNGEIVWVSPMWVTYRP